jgi:hypothetical protein
MARAESGGTDCGCHSGRHCAAAGKVGGKKDRLRLRLRAWPRKARGLSHDAANRYFGETNG